MTQQTQLSPSPLAIERHEFTSIRLEASEATDPTGALQLKTRRSLEKDVEDANHWRLSLTIEFGPNAADAPAPYSGAITIIGSFRIAEGYPQEKHRVLVNVTAASILYGACREMLVNLTARSTHGILSLPSISFVLPEGPEEYVAAPSQKTGSKGNTAKRVRRKTGDA